MFQSFLDGAESFEALSDGVRFESVGRGRLGAVMMVIAPDGTLPIMRSTTKYYCPHQEMTPAMLKLRDAISDNIPFSHFNNALVEQYTHEYRTMGAHSDMAIDLAEDSWICLFTCYDNSLEVDLRKLVVTDKTTGVSKDFILHHNSIVWFSTDTNRTHKHAIVALDNVPKKSSSTWLGITFRCSKRSVTHDEGHVFLETGEELTLATTRQMYKERSEENATCGVFTYSCQNVTVSPSDLMPLK